MQSLIAVETATSCCKSYAFANQATTSPLIRVAGVAQVMHAEGLVHRDIKPANIMRCHDERAGGETYKLIDFGTALGVDERIARLTMMTIGTNRGIGAGTPPYMSPEMFRVRHSLSGPVGSHWGRAWVRKGGFSGSPQTLLSAMRRPWAGAAGSAPATAR